MPNGHLFTSTGADELRLQLHEGPEAFDALATQWDALAERVPSPFLTHAWLAPWWEAFGSGELVTAAVHGRDGTLRAGATFARARLGALRATANEHSTHWGAVSSDASAQARLWSEVAALRAPSLTLASLDEAGAVDVADALTSRGRIVHARTELTSPFAPLPSSFDELLASRSANLRSQVNRRRRALEREGALRMRTLRGAEALGADFDAFLRVEASGWKARSGTAISAQERTERMYRRFAEHAAERGWLRLHLLELDGRLTAGDLSCAMGGVEFLVKTGFDEGYRQWSPGLVLRAEVLRAAVEEGLAGYDFLGGPDAYKLRWTDQLRTRTTLRGFRGIRGRPPALWWTSARPALRRVRNGVRQRAGRVRGEP